MSQSSISTFDRFLVQVVDGCLAGVILIVPFLMGGRHAIGQLALTILSVVAASAWTLRQYLQGKSLWRPTWANGLLLAGLGLLLLQLTPLSPTLLHWLTPHSAALLPLWNPSEPPKTALGVWSCVSLTPRETLSGLVLFLDYAFLFLVTVQRIEQIEDVEQLLRWCVLAAVGMATFGIVQLLTSNGKFFWFYQHPLSLASGVAKGSFSNRNHFADFLALGVGPLIWWLQDMSRQTRARVDTTKWLPPRHRQNAEIKSYVLMLALGIILFAGLLSLSRGGISVIFIATLIATVLCYSASAIRGRFMIGFVVITLLIGTSLTIFGWDRVSHRLEELFSGSIEKVDQQAGRRTIWAATMKAIPDFLPIGSGIGSFHDVYPTYTDAILDDQLEYTHAENCYLQTALESGASGFALIMAGVVLIGFWCFQGGRPRAAMRLRVCAAALTASLAASMVHAMVDFVWYVPACMAVVAILAACALRVRELGEERQEVKHAARGEHIHSSPLASGDSSSRHPRHVALHVNSSKISSKNSSVNSHGSPLVQAVAFVGVLMAAWLGGWMVIHAFGPAIAQPYWDDYLYARHTMPCQSPEVLDDIDLQQRWIAGLKNVIHWQPDHVQAHLALAECHRWLFDAMQKNAANQMTLTNIRDAAVQSQFASRQALAAWLLRAVGPHWTYLDQALDHAILALRLNPLQGRNYIYLADLSFLGGADAAINHAFIQQSLRVRPFDGVILRIAGNEALLAGDTTLWLHYSKQVFHCPSQQQQWIRDLVRSAPDKDLPAVIDFILREFKPNLHGLRCLHGACEKRCSPEQLFPLMRRRVDQARLEAQGLGNSPAADLWLETSYLYRQLNDPVEALLSARKALECNPDRYEIHEQLTTCLLHERLFAEAETHIRWCLQRSPNNSTLEARLREAIKGRLDSRRHAATGNDILR